MVSRPDKHAIWTKVSTFVKVSGETFTAALSRVKKSVKGAAIIPLSAYVSGASELKVRTSVNAPGVR
jgi:hypothetical protein